MAVQPGRIECVCAVGKLVAWEHKEARHEVAFADGQLHAMLVADAEDFIQHCLVLASVSVAARTTSMDTVTTRYKWLSIASTARHAMAGELIRPNAT